MFDSFGMDGVNQMITKEQYIHQIKPLMLKLAKRNTNNQLIENWFSNECAHNKISVCLLCGYEFEPNIDPKIFHEHAYNHLKERNLLPFI